MAWVRSYGAGTAAAAASLTVTLTISPAAGNMLIANVAFNVGFTMTTPTGWTFLVNESQSGSRTMQTSVYYKVAAGTETTVVFTPNASDRMTASYSEFSLSDGVIYGTVQNGSAVDATAIASTQLTSVPSGAMNVACFGAVNSGNATTTITGTSWTERSDQDATGAGDRMHTAHASNGVSSGTVSACTSTWTGTMNSLAAVSFYLLPVGTNILRPDLLMAM